MAGATPITSLIPVIMFPILFGLSMDYEVFVVASPVPSVKMLGLGLGLGLATAILTDATVVLLVLVPATMSLLGRANWWLPRWLDRALPRVTVDAPP